MQQNTFKKSQEALRRADPVLGAVIVQARLKALHPTASPFESLAVSIISQQLSTKAAYSIRARFIAEFGGVFPDPVKILKKSDARLRACGLSGAKVSYIKNLARAAQLGEVDFKRLRRLDDEAVIDMLTKVKGIGRWTAEMFLIFSLRRPDVFSHGDLGLRNAIKKLYKLDPAVHTKKYIRLIESWRPYRSLAARHLWASLDNAPGA